MIEKQLPLYPTVTEEVMVLVDRVTEAQLFANKVSYNFLPQIKLKVLIYKF